MIYVIMESNLFRRGGEDVKKPLEKGTFRHGFF